MKMIIVIIILVVVMSALSFWAGYEKRWRDYGKWCESFEKFRVAKAEAMPVSKRRYKVTGNMATEDHSINIADSDLNRITIENCKFVSAETVELNFCDKCQGVIQTPDMSEKNTTWTGDTFFCQGH